MNLDFFMKAPLLSNSIRHTFQIGYLSTYLHMLLLSQEVGK